VNCGVGHAMTSETKPIASSSNKTSIDHDDCSFCRALGTLRATRERFRRAMREYFETAESEFRCAHGLCCRNEDNGNSKMQLTRKRKRQWVDDATTIPADVIIETRGGHGNDNDVRKYEQKSVGACANCGAFSNKNDRYAEDGNFRSMPLRRCPKRPQYSTQVASPLLGDSLVAPAKPVHKPELEQELVRCLLEAYFRIVELAIEGYRHSIKQQTQILRRELRHQLRGDSNELHSHSRKGDASSSYNSICSWVKNELEGHYAEVQEEKHMSIASVMVAVKETRVTEVFANKIHTAVSGILADLHGSIITFTICALGNRELHPSNGEEENRGHNENPFNSTKRKSNNLKISDDTSSHAEEVWDRTVVDALKIDGYYRWFRVHNAVVLKNGGIMGRRTIVITK
jgi:hypothetical protein